MGERKTQSPAPVEPYEDGAARLPLHEIPTRISRICMLRGFGFSFREIASEYSVTPQAISIMLLRYKRALHQTSPSLDLVSLSARAIAVLKIHGIFSREQAAQEGFIEKLKAKGARNCGSKTLQELERWAQNIVDRK